MTPSTYSSGNRFACGRAVGSNSTTRRQQGLAMKPIRILSLQSGTAVSTSVLALLSTMPAAYAQTTDTWSLGASGLWSVAGNWSAAVVPNNGTPTGATYNVDIVDGVSTVTLNISAGINDLSLASGNTLAINNGDTLTINGPAVANSGAIQVNGGAGNNGFININANTTLSGSGTVTLSTAAGGGNAFLQQGVAGVTLTNSGNTIQGTGIIGNGGLAIVNSSGGTIDANVSGGVLNVEQQRRHHQHRTDRGDQRRQPRLQRRGRDQHRRQAHGHWCGQRDQPVQLERHRRHPQDERRRHDRIRGHDHAERRDHFDGQHLHREQQCHDRRLRDDHQRRPHPDQWRERGQWLVLPQCRHDAERRRNRHAVDGQRRRHAPTSIRTGPRPSPIRTTSSRAPASSATAHSPSSTAAPSMRTCRRAC